MIACLKGELFSKTPDRVIVNVGGVGYEVFISRSSHEQLPAVGREIFLHVYTNVREDSLKLFGFWEADEKEMFLLLIAVNGVGPKLAMGILSGIRPLELARAIAAKDLKRLTSLVGVGKKLAERLCLDLQDKVYPAFEAGRGPVAEEPPAGADDQLAADVISGLVNLGYSRVKAQEALSAVKKRLPAADFSAMKIEDLFRETLRSIA